MKRTTTMTPGQWKRQQLQLEDMERRIQACMALIRSRLGEEALNAFMAKADTYTDNVLKLRPRRRLPKDHPL
jgi:hypothetical protein